MERKRSAALRAWIAAALFALAVWNAVPVRALDESGVTYIVKYKEGVTRRRKDPAVPFEVVSAAEMRRLERAGLLEWSEPDTEMRFLDLPDGGQYADDKWDLAMIRADAALEQGFLGRGVRVGVIDSGINPHPMLAERLLPGRNYLDGARADDTVDNYGHGTLVAGLIAASGADGAVGPATEAELVPLKVTDGKGIMVSTVCRAIYGGIDDYGCDVLNLSLGITSDFAALKEAVEYAESRGVVVVSAVGNRGNDRVYYPAAYESVIGVGAVDRTGTAYSGQNWNTSVFVTAPGVEVKTTSHSGGYVTSSGTSFSVPFVSAAAAILLGLDASLSPAELRGILAETAEDLGDEGYDARYGYGLLNLAGCIAAAAEPADADFPCVFSGPDRLWNTGDAELDCTYLLAEYDAAWVCRGVRSWRLTIPAHSSVPVTPPEDGAHYGQFVYETATMTPLARARKSL